MSATLTQYLIAGGLAGTAVDVVLFPLDTLKTRLQSPHGFIKSGGFARIYSGLLPALLASAPNAAIFFMTYETVKQKLHSARFSGGEASSPSSYHALLVPMVSGSCAEMVACIVRVPAEILKQRLQASQFQKFSQVLEATLRRDGLRGLYHGYLTTLSREIPFTCIQFPIYELNKRLYGHHMGRPVHAWEAALCGSVAGGIAAGVTTPLDVVKTRRMLHFHTDAIVSATHRSTISTFMHIYSTEGVKKLFAGIMPRILWISLGGAIFFGAYEKAKGILINKNAL